MMLATNKEIRSKEDVLNIYITLCMAFLAHMVGKPETNALRVLLIKEYCSQSPVPAGLI